MISLYYHLTDFSCVGLASKVQWTITSEVSLVTMSVGVMSTTGGSDGKIFIKLFSLQQKSSFKLTKNLQSDWSSVRFLLMVNNDLIVALTSDELTIFESWCNKRDSTLGLVSIVILKKFFKCNEMLMYFSKLKTSKRNLKSVRI